MSRRIAFFKVDQDVLLAALGLPADASILAAKIDDAYQSGVVRLTIEHAGLKEVPIGNAVAAVNVKAHTRIVESPPKFVEWLQ